MLWLKCTRLELGYDREQFDPSHGHETKLNSSRHNRCNASPTKYVELIFLDTWGCYTLHFTSLILHIWIAAIKLLQLRTATNMYPCDFGVGVSIQIIAWSLITAMTPLFRSKSCGLIEFNAASWKPQFQFHKQTLKTKGTKYKKKH